MVRRAEKRVVGVGVGLLLIAVGAPYAQSYEIVLRVNERIATSYDFARRRAEKISAIQAAESLSPERRQRLLAEVGVSTMNDIFEELLMLSRADQLRIDVSESDVDRAVESTKKNLGIETQEDLERALLASRMTIDDLRANMRRSLLVQKLMSQEVHPRITLEEEDLRRYYQNHSEEFQEPERLHLQEVVLLDSSDLAEEEKARLAEEIRQQVESGGDLAEVAEPYAERGISTTAVDLGWVELGDLDPELEAAVWDLEAGQVSAPTSGRGGLHVLLVSERREARLKSFAEVEAEIRATEGERLLNDEMQKYMQELQARAYVVANPPPSAAGFRASLSAAATTDDLAEALTAPLITEPSEPVEDQPSDSGDNVDDAQPEEPPQN